jgi:hypothetical protein
MKAYIRRWIQSCHVCQIRKDPPEKARMSLGQYQVGGRWERVACDIMIMGPFTTTDRDNSYLLVIGDYKEINCE